MDKIQQNRLGWNPSQRFERRSEWGLDEIQKKKEWLCLPVGIVIPFFRDGTIQKIKIRKADWKEGDPYGKYCEVPGSSNGMPIIGNPLHPIAVIVEPEFDAMLLAQQAGDLCSCLALGGAQKRPDATTHRWLQERKLILYALDYDEAGKKEYAFWRTTYPTVKAWPVPREKSPGDYFAAGGDVRKWIEAGIRKYQPTGSELFLDDRSVEVYNEKSEKKL